MTEHHVTATPFNHLDTVPIYRYMIPKVYRLCTAKKPNTTRWANKNRSLCYQLLVKKGANAQCWKICNFKRTLFSVSHTSVCQIRVIIETVLFQIYRLYLSVNNMILSNTMNTNFITQISWNISQLFLDISFRFNRAHYTGLRILTE